MACPTCNQTMHNIGTQRFWCPNCGTLLTREETTHETKDVSVPKVIPATLLTIEECYEEVLPAKATGKLNELEKLIEPDIGALIDFPPKEDEDA